MKLELHPINIIRDYTFRHIPRLYHLLSDIKHGYYLDIKTRLAGGPPLPPANLRYLVAGTNDLDWFLRSGKLGEQCIRDILAKNNIDIGKFVAILDFGCGSARVLRYWNTLPKTVAVHGCDYNPDLIAWCQKALTFAHFTVNPGMGRLEYPDNKFDLVYALSVFTHLTEISQMFWIKELTRITKPGGYLFITLHGDFYLPQLSPEDLKIYSQGGMVVQGEGHEGSNICTVFHSRDYVLNRLAAGLTLIDHIPEGAAGNPRQDVYLFKKPDAQ